MILLMNWIATCIKLLATKLSLTMLNVWVYHCFVEGYMDQQVKQQIPSVTAVSSGAIASDYQRLRVESVCTRLGLVSLAYLWKEDQVLLLEEMIRRGIVAVIIKVAAMGLNQKHLGRELVDLQSHLLQMNELYGINVCGEGGEYETLTLDCPLFNNARIVLDKFQVVLHSPDSIAPVGIVHPLAFHLEHKIDYPSYRYMENNDFTSEKRGCVFHVKEDLSPNYLKKCNSKDVIFDKFDTIDSAKMSISTCKRGTFSIGCWVPNSTPCEGLQKDLAAVLHSIELQLRKDKLNWSHVLYIHLYISDMKQFGVANDVYMSFITETNCYFGVPSRSTIEIPIAEIGLGNAYVEVLVSTDRCKRVLHVQSISCWAPSCIGPYSQATLHKEVLYMAGQLGLDPPTMLLHPGGPALEMDQALLNCEAVANYFKSSLATSAIGITVYCSASLSSSEAVELQNRMHHFLKYRTSHNEGFLGEYNPISLYVLVPNLPKGALVEVKPVLHLAENGKSEVQSVMLKEPGPTTPIYSGFSYSDWHNRCCQVNVVPGKICMALISGTKDHVGSILSEVDVDLVSIRSGSLQKHLKAIVLFFISLIDKIISENGFSWQDLQSLRFYFSTDLATTADFLFPIFSEAFIDFAESGSNMDATNVPHFNLLPVLASGISAAMNDLITCELFASKLES
ncbi:diphthine--ammonia ligase isoform X2 [Phalaenopsis equestris]|uniref:diphthine--ammonia ligase isoform X2 n=1 Tax=Phalaenopsis equestris TaxID=78828 RepID=UPI0009E2AA25|nr:diphthine--ammonia ligase isoform X2 [Phalaenopsis equestris]